MRITPIFNEAAQPGDDQTFVEGPSSPAPNAPSSAALSVEPDDRRVAVNEQNHLWKQTSSEFRHATADHGANEATGPHPGMKYRTDPDAMALLEMLEAGRAEPAFKYNYRPPPHIERIVHTEVEAKREEMIAELRADWDREMSFDPDPDFTAEDRLEPMF